MAIGMLQPVTARALTPLEPQRQCSLTLHYRQEGMGFPDIPVRIYRVAEAFPDGTFELISPYSAYPVNIHGITSQTEWQTVSTTLTAYIAANRLAPDTTATTDENGTVVLAGLKTGLYLVCGAVAENEKGTYFFREFMVYLPTPAEDGFTYDVEAVPKCGKFTPMTEYRVVKLWKDSGNSRKRPDSVEVELREDGILRQTVTLSKENDWTYEWKDADGNGVWTVAEKNVPSGYRVSIGTNGNAFTITNTYPTPPSTPDTGDTTPLWLYIVIMCFSGFMLMILGTLGLRGKDHEKRK
jgi:hypothetical protein